ncbi:MAG TPA: alkaline phosphatase family protein [Candidatus Angelobacter sp.]|nr:alkaline phosphatase family protein [Candidatus Angelobacter sp.]
MNRPLAALVLSLICIALLSCGGVSHSSPPAPPVPAADHVFLVVLENHGFGQVIGNPAMPYLNSLANADGLATAYFANAHPSIPNYFVLTTGNIETLDDSFTGVITDDNLVRALNGAGKTWKAYIGNLPSTGYTGPDVGTYLKRHNPFAYLNDVLTSSAQAANMVSFSQFSADLAAGNLANFVYMLPDSQNDAHDCPGGAPTCDDNAKLAAADNWLRANIDPLLKSPKFGNSVLVITFDEAQQTDFTNGGGQVATVLAGPHVKPNSRVNTMFQHQSTLRLILDALKVGDMPGASNSAPSMGGFFQ